MDGRAERVFIDPTDFSESLIPGEIPGNRSMPASLSLSSILARKITTRRQGFPVSSNSGMRERFACSGL